MLVAISSKNPVKINAIKGAFEKVFPDGKFIFKGISCESNVSNQPMGEDETLNGALNRLTELATLEPKADFLASIEGGIIDHNGSLSVFAWVVVKSKDKESRAKSAMFELPESLAKHVRDGKELGEADDIVFNRKNSKQGDGTIGKLTGGLIDRTAYYEHPAILALSPWANPEIY